MLQLFSKRTKILGAFLIGSLLFLSASLYADYRSWQQFRAEWGDQVNFPLSDFRPESPGLLLLCRFGFLVFITSGVSTFTSAIVDIRRRRRST